MQQKLKSGLFNEATSFRHPSTVFFFFLTRIVYKLPLLELNLVKRKWTESKLGLTYPNLSLSPPGRPIRNESYFQKQASCVVDSPLTSLSE